MKELTPTLQPSGKENDLQSEGKKPRWQRPKITFLGKVQLFVQSANKSPDGADGDGFRKSPGLG